MSAQLPSRRPWPLKWIVVAIVVFIVPYTWLTLKYYKPGKPYEPYEDNKNRANVGRLLDAGYQRIEAAAERPADPGRLGIAATAHVDLTLGGLPDLLGKTLVEPPLLPQEFDAVSAPAEVGAQMAYRISFNCVLPDNKRQFAGADLYLREHSIVIVPRFETIPPDLLARTNQSPVVITVPAGALKPGQYTLTLAATKRSRQWSLEVR